MKSNNHWPRIQLSALAIVGFFYSFQVVAASYSITDFGTFGGTASGALAINNSGEVTGWASVTGNSTPHAFLYSNGFIQDLGTLEGTRSAGFAINASGQIAGHADIPVDTTGNTA